MSKITPNDLGLGSHTTSLNSLPHIIANVLFTFVGALSVIFIIVGGIMYTISGGDPKKTAQAKDTLLYAIIGMVIAAVAGLIVKFVLNS